MRGGSSASEITLVVLSTEVRGVMVGRALTLWYHWKTEIDATAGLISNEGQVK